MPLQTLKKISLLAEKLDVLMQKVVLVGDTALEFYATDEAAEEHRTSTQIDLLVQASSIGDLYHWGEIFQAKGFEPLDSSMPHQSFGCEGLKIKIMPFRPVIRGEQQNWYEEGAFQAYTHQLPSGQRIRLLPIAYFLAAQIEAVNSSPTLDFRTDEAFEDLIYIFNIRLEIVEDVAGAYYEVREYIQRQFANWLQNPSLEEGICYALPFEAGYIGISKIQNTLKALSRLNMAHAKAS